MTADQVDKLIKNMPCGQLYDGCRIEGDKLYIEFYNDEIDVEDASIPINIEGWTLIDVQMYTKVHYEYSTSCVITFVFVKSPNKIN